jgi:hypothetical protein
LSADNDRINAQRLVLHAVLSSATTERAFGWAIKKNRDWLFLEMTIAEN